jgi:hypothetical protein
MYKKIDEIKALLAMIRLAKTDNERLAICAEIIEMQSVVIEDLDNAAKDLEKKLHFVLELYVPPSALRDDLVNFDYTKHMNNG